MAKLDMGILGGFSGRVGTVVGYNRRGAWFVRAYQPHIKDRKSEAQLQQRSRFKAMIQFASPATPVLRVGLKRLAADQQITEGNAFLRLNHRNFLNNLKNQKNQNIQIDYPSLQFSQGTLAVPKGLQYAVDESGVLSVRWAADGGGLADDIHIYIYSPVAGRGLTAVAERGRRGVQLLLPEEFASGELHLWAFAASSQGNVSATVYGTAMAQPAAEDPSTSHPTPTHTTAPAPPESAAGRWAFCSDFG